MYTESAIYFGVVLLDRDPSGLTTSDSRRDSPLDDTDSFRIALDTYRDRQNGFVFATTPSGLEYDGQLNGEGTKANTGVFIVYKDSHPLDESPFRPSNADRSFIVKISRMFDALQ